MYIILYVKIVSMFRYAVHILFVLPVLVPDEREREREREREGERERLSFDN